MSILKTILIVGAALVGIFLLLLYYVLKDHTKDISKKEPYKNVIGKRLTLKQEAIIVKNLPEFSKFSTNLLTRKGEPLFEGTSILHVLPKGTELTIFEFRSVSSGPSDYWTGYGKGKVFIKELTSEIDFEYVWGGTRFTYTTDNSILFSFGTPLWEPCPFNDDLQGQSMAEVKDFENAIWDSVNKKARVPISSKDTLILSAGGCLRYNGYVGYSTSEQIDLDDHKYWNGKMNWVFEHVFKSEAKRFTDALKNKTIVYDSSLSDVGRRVYLFSSNEYYSTNNVTISSDGKSALLEISWWENEKERVPDSQ
jgi:hypothetical protein